MLHPGDLSPVTRTRVKVGESQPHDFHLMVISVTAQSFPQVSFIPAPRRRGNRQKVGKLLNCRSSQLDRDGAKLKLALGLPAFHTELLQCLKCAFGLRGRTPHQEGTLWSLGADTLWKGRDWGC